MENKNNDIIRMELRIERLPEIFNKQAYKVGVRTIVRRNQKLRIGLPGAMVAFSHHEYNVLADIIARWHKLGRPENGEVYRSGELLTFSEFTDSLYGGIRKFRDGGSYRKRVEKWIDNLMSIPIKHETLMENGDRAMGSFTFLIGSIEKKNKDGYFDLTAVKIHPTIVESLLAHNVKPVRLDVIRKLRGDNESLFYRELDLLLSKRNVFEKPLIQFCNDLGITYNFEKSYAFKARRICKKLVGKELSSGGMLGHCFIETKEGVPYICARKVPIETVKDTIIMGDSPPNKENVEFEDHRKFLREHYEQFSPAEKIKVEEIQKRLLETFAYPEFQESIDTCFYQAITNVLDQEFTKNKIYSKVYECRQTPPPESAYQRDPEFRPKPECKRIVNDL